MPDLNSIPYLIIFLCIFGGLGVRGMVCPERAIKGFPGFGTAPCYLYERFETQFVTAERMCRASGGHLASINDGFVNAFIAHGANEAFLIMEAEDFWVGGENLDEQSRWDWVDGESWGPYTNWDQAQPNNDTLNRCIGLKLSDGKWRSKNCFDRKPYVCEFGYADSNDTTIFPTTPKWLTTTPTPVDRETWSTTLATLEPIHTTSIARTTTEASSSPELSTEGPIVQSTTSPTPTPQNSEKTDGPVPVSSEKPSTPPAQTSTTTDESSTRPAQTSTEEPSTRPAQTSTKEPSTRPAPTSTVTSGEPSTVVPTSTPVSSTQQEPETPTSTRALDTTTIRDLETTPTSTVQTSTVVVVTTPEPSTTTSNTIGIQTTTQEPSTSTSTTTQEPSTAVVTTTQTTTTTEEPELVPTCPDDWLYIEDDEGGDDLCYNGYPSQGWEADRTFCESQNSTLISIHDTPKYLKTFIYKIPENPKNIDLTIGIYETFDRGVRRWVWADQSPVDWENWYHGYPKPAVGDELRCGVAYTNTQTYDPLYGQWKHVPCDSVQKHVICVQEPTLEPEFLLVKKRKNNENSAKKPKNSHVAGRKKLGEKKPKSLLQKPIDKPSPIIKKIYKAPVNL